MPDRARAGRLRGIELFSGLDAAQLEWVAAVGEPVRLADGDVLFEDGQPGEHFYVLLSGELLITKVIDGRVQVLARHSARPGQEQRPQPGGGDKPRAAHQFTGELPLLAGGGYVARGTAVGDTELLAYDRDMFLEMIVRCPQVCRVLLPVLAWRIRSYEVQAGRRAMLSGLGTLAAGLAHELNNPTAAVVRAAAELRGTVRGLAGWSVTWGWQATEAELALVARLGDAIAAGAAGRRPQDALEAADAADLVDDWLTDRGLDCSAEFATTLADHGVDAAVLDTLAGGVRPQALKAAIGTLAYGLRAAVLAADISEAGGRIEGLVRSARSYSDLDRAPVRDVDLREGIEATLAMHASRLQGVRIVRDYAPLPEVTAYPSELNQVWGNLIHNAADAMCGRGELRISTRIEDGCAVVEIRDDGCGIPQEALPMLFQPFFTTKDIGKGTGLGLHLSHDIVTVRHNGSIDVSSVPGDTRFTVRLPCEQRETAK